MIAKLSFRRQEGALGTAQKKRGADQRSGGIELEIFHRVVSITKGLVALDKSRRFNVKKNQSLRGRGYCAGRRTGVLLLLLNQKCQNKVGKLSLLTPAEVAHVCMCKSVRLLLESTQAEYRYQSEHPGEYMKIHYECINRN